MDTYPCPACGGVADSDRGCRSCGRAHDPTAAELYQVNRAMAGLDDEASQLATNQSELTARRARLHAQRLALSKQIIRGLSEESAHARQQHPGRLGEPGSAARPAAQTRRPTGAHPAGSRPTRTSTVPMQRPPGVRLIEPAAGGATGAETSGRSAMNSVLALGGVLIALAAVGVYATTDRSGVRPFVLAIGTTMALVVPVILARHTLTATAETIAAVGLLLVLLDGYLAYAADVAGLGRVPGVLFAALLFGLVALVAIGYRLATHLRAPQFAALLAIQPLLPLIGIHFGLGWVGLAAVGAAMATQNLAAVAILRLPPRPALIAGAAAAATLRWPRMLRELAWVLAGLALASAAVLAGYSLVVAADAAGAARTGGVVLLVAASGVLAGRLSGRAPLRELATGVAALALAAVLSRVAVLAWPAVALVVTGAAVAVIATGAALLPARVRTGPLLGSAAAAAVTAAVVLVEAVRSAVATVGAAVRPELWAADLAEYAARSQVTSWQVPITAALFVAGALATPGRWRPDALLLAGGMVILAAPATALVPWWLPPWLGVAYAALATAAALRSRAGAAALGRTSAAGLLGGYAVVTSLARPEATAGVCAALTLIAAVTAGVGAAGPGRFGPYADRVADSATGAAAITLPITAGSVAYLLGAPPGVLLPVTTLATAIGVLAAALSQVAASLPRTAGAGGALAAAAGGLVLTLRLPGATPADVLLGVLVLTAAVLTASARAFEASGDQPGLGAAVGVAGGAGPGGGVADAVGHGVSGAVRSVPAAAGAPADAFGGDHAAAAAARGWLPRLDRVTAAAGAATGATILALARLLAVAVPGIGLVTTIAMVLAVMLAVRALPDAWRWGPRLGGIAVGGVIALVTAAVAAIEAAGTLAAATPWWHADLAAWPDHVSAWAPYGWQVPATLLLAAGAAVVSLPAPRGGDLGFVALALAGLAAPAALHLDWWSPVLIAGVLAVAAGAGAALVGPDDPDAAANRRLGLAAVLAAYAVAAAAATAASTAIALSGVVAAGALVTGLAQSRAWAPPVVSGIATAGALTAAPGAAATLAVLAGATRPGVLGTGMAVAWFGVFLLGALRFARVRWRAFPAAGVAISAVLIALPEAPDPRRAQVWAALAALAAVSAAATVRPDRAAGRIIAVTAAPAALLAAVGSAPAWVTALFGPYRTAQQAWRGFAVAPVPPGAGPAVLTLALLAAVAAVGAWTLRGRRYIFASVAAPLAALALVAPTAAGAPRAATPAAALLVALATGLGAALVRPAQPEATRALRATSAVVCALTGSAGLAGSLAHRGTTLAALGLVVLASAVAVVAGKDPAVRMVAWVSGAMAALALPVTWFAAAGQPLPESAFVLLAICAALVGGAWLVAREANRRAETRAAETRAAEARVAEACAALGAVAALVLVLGSVRYAAAVLTIWGLLLGGSALRRDRTPAWRRRLVRAGLAAELGASWLALYSVEVGLPEAYTLPFALAALGSGVYELRHRPELSSWLAYGPALAGGFLPSLVLVLIGADPLWRWVSLFAAAVTTVIVGAWRRRHAPVMTGAAVAVGVALIEMVRLLILGEIAGALLVAAAGLILIAVGAGYERRLRGALR